jgi:hypothetical protein
MGAACCAHTAFRPKTHNYYGKYEKGTCKNLQVPFINRWRLFDTGPLRRRERLLSNLLCNKKGVSLLS